MIRRRLRVSTNARHGLGRRWWHCGQPERAGAEATDSQNNETHDIVTLEVAKASHDDWAGNCQGPCEQRREPEYLAKRPAPKIFAANCVRYGPLNPHGEPVQNAAQHGYFERF